MVTGFLDKGFGIKDMTEIRSQCAFCKHFHRKVYTKNACDAFPDGVPTPVIWGDVKHTKPYKGDHGIRFERVGKLEGKTKR